jgi:hypothetical protein
MNQSETPTPLPATKRPRSIGQLGLQLFLTAVGLGVLTVVGSIAVNAVKNDGLMPTPSTLDRYECTGASMPFSFYYLHGTERVEIKSKAGALEGTISQNWFDWRKFAQDRTLLGFAPPAEITFEDARSLRMAGPDFSDVLCVNTVDTRARRRGTLP